MKKPATRISPLASPLIWGPKTRQHARIPQFFVMSDMVRLPDPRLVFDHLPRGSAIVLRHTDPSELARLAHNIIPCARQRGLKVLISNDVRLAHRLGADGVHLSQACFQTGHWRRYLMTRKPGFLVTAAYHMQKAVKLTTALGVDALFISPVFETQSHPGARPLGWRKLVRFAHRMPMHAIALGGINARNIKRLKGGHIYGVAAIGAWCPPNQ